MAEETKKQSEEVQFPLNKRLLEESIKIKEERKVIKERLAKIEESKTDVSETVFEKVHSDYITKLNANTDQLLEKKQDIDRELATLYEAKKKVEENVSVHREKLEEINFRHGLGEFKDEEFHKLAEEENEKLGKFEKILAAIESNIKQYESLFEGEEELGMGEEALEEAPPPPPPPGEAGTDEFLPEDEYQVGGGDYFAAETGKVSFKPEEAGEETSPEVTPVARAEELEEGEEVYPTISIEEGFGKGEVYEVKKDQMMIGRAGGNDIVLKEAKVSRQHASIKKHGNEYLIEDLHSSNGVFVNDEKIKEHALSDGDTIRIGDFVMKFTMKA